MADCSDESEAKKSYRKIDADLLTSCRSPMQGNLTGMPRKVKDSVADISNNLDYKWKNMNARGTDILSQIANAKLSTEAAGPKYTEDMAVLCRELDKIYSEMELIISKMERVTGNLKAIAELESQQKRDSRSDVLFLTWPAEKFYETSNELLKMYKKELDVKRRVKESIAHLSNRDEIMVTVSTWQHQPHINDRVVESLIKAALLETEHTRIS